MATIKDVARYAGVSKSTVSNVITKKKYVSEDISKRVEKACQELNYVPSFMAMSLVTKKTGIIGLFLGTEDRYDEFYGDLIKGVVLQAKNSHYKVLIYYAVREEEMKVSLTVDKAPIDGAILLNPFSNDFRVGQIKQDKIPFVLIGNMYHDESIYGVDVDNELVTYKLTQKLIDNGHKHFLFATINTDFSVSSDRISGFRRALAQNGIPESNTDIIITDYYGDRVAHFLESNMTKLPLRLAVIVPSDVVGARVYEIAEKYGLRVGQDLSVIALGGKSVAFNLKPPLTTVEVDYSKIGAQCVSLLIRQIEKKPIEHRNILVDNKIIYTASCADFTGTDASLLCEVSER